MDPAPNFAIPLGRAEASPDGIPAGPAPGPQTLSETGSTGFARVEADLSRAINADHAVFHASAIAGRDAYAGLDVVVIAAAVLMAAGCAWGLSRRLAEYR